MRGVKDLISEVELPPISNDEMEEEAKSVAEKVEYAEIVEELTDLTPDGSEMAYSGKTEVKTVNVPDELAPSTPLDKAFIEEARAVLDKQPEMSREEKVYTRLRSKRSKNSAGSYQMIKAIKDHLPTRELINALAGQNFPPKFHRLLNMVVDPKHANVSLPILCQRCHVSYMELVTAVKEYKLGESILRMLLHVGDVMEDVAQDAKSQPIPCPHCARTKDKECLFCKGTGIKMVPGDATARKLLYESMGMTGQTPAVANQINVNVSGESLEETIKGATLKIKPREIKDATT